MKTIIHTPNGHGLWIAAFLAGSFINLLLFGVLSRLGGEDALPPTRRIINVSLDLTREAVVDTASTVSRPSVPKAVKRPRPEKKTVKREQRPLSPRPREQTAPRDIPKKPEPAEKSVHEPSPPAPSNTTADATETQEHLPAPVPVYRLSGLPRFIHQEKPVYPPHLRRRGKEATVKLEIYIDANGEVRDIRILKSAGPAFDQAAVAAIRASTFAPGHVAGKPVPVLMRLPIRFRLR